jgi:hypothetical protein
MRRTLHPSCGDDLPHACAESESELGFLPTVRLCYPQKAPAQAKLGRATRECNNACDWLGHPPRSGEVGERVKA